MPGQPPPKIRGAEFKIGTRPFKNKTAATATVQAILNTGWKIGEPITGDDHDLLRDLLRMHPHYKEKAAKGVAGFTVLQIRRPNCGPQRCFHIIHPDGTTTDFSYPVCFDPSKGVPVFREAARYAVAPYMEHFKRLYNRTAFADHCSRCVKNCAGKQHIHHAAPNTFREILRQWCDLHGEPAVHAVEPYGADFDDSEVKDQFIRFHNERAETMILCTKCHGRAEKQDLKPSAVSWRHTIYDMLKEFNQ